MSISLNDHLLQAKAKDDLRHLIVQLASATKAIHHAIRTSDTGLAGTKNLHGDSQVKLDVLSDDIIHACLHKSGLVASYISEEKPDVIELSDKAPYSVVFDPLDGSSLVDVNFAIGSIFGIYPSTRSGQVQDLIGTTPRKQIAALYALYGPRTVLVYSSGNGVHEFALDEMGDFRLVREFLGVGDTAKNYSPGNLKAIHDNPQYGSLLQHWLEKKLTLRYSGCMVADVHHILSKGQGIFTNVGSGSAPAKLRLVFECGPFAYLMEQAGGVASNGTKPILDVTIDSIDQRSPLMIGSKNDVDDACTALKG